MSRAKRWCFTINNWTDVHVQLLSVLVPLHAEYVVYGREVGENGTPHLQGFVVFKDRKRLSTARNLVGGGHFETTRSTNERASAYCKKDNDFDEFGQLPDDIGQGKRTDIDRFVDWIATLEQRPTDRDVAREFPSLWLRSRDRIHQLIVHLREPVELGIGNPRVGWQTDLLATIQEQPNDRDIQFVVDPVGNQGKSWMCRHLLTVRDDVQVLRIGKRDDLAHMIDETKKIFLFDVPRTQMEYLQYPILESLKDRLVCSPKYNSTMKVLEHVPHVIVFSNEQPDFNALSNDRIKVTNI